jgi:hypothetical protein
MAELNLALNYKVRLLLIQLVSAQEHIRGFSIQQAEIIGQQIHRLQLKPLQSL